MVVGFSDLLTGPFACGVFLFKPNFSFITVFRIRLHKGLSKGNTFYLALLEGDCLLLESMGLFFLGNDLLLREKER